MSDNKNTIGKYNEHEVYKNTLNAYEEAENSRNKYKKYGPIFIIVSGIILLTLMFSLDYKIEFLIIWVASVLFCAALMIKAEYKYHQFQLMLGLIDENEDDEYDDERLED